MAIRSMMIKKCLKIFQDFCLIFSDIKMVIFGLSVMLYVLSKLNKNDQRHSFREEIFYQSFMCTLWKSIIFIILREKKKLKNSMAPFYWWGSTASRLRSHYEETVDFLPLSFQELLLGWKAGRMKGWVDLGALQWFCNWDP